LLQRPLPFPDRHRPFFLDVFQGQVEQIEDRLAVREQAPILDNFPQAVIERFNRVGRVDLEDSRGTDEGSELISIPGHYGARP
jgi:hypothetical protein